MSRSDSDVRSCRSCGADFPEGNAFCGVCGAREPLADQSLSDHLIGQVVDRKFRLEACIATGGMGAVYRAEHVGIGKQVAIKFLRADLRGQPQLVHRLRREAKAVSKLTDVHSISVFDFGVWQSLAYLVMEYLQGEDLAEILNREKRFETKRALHIAKSICSSLAEAHGVGVIHRDLKPENVFLTYSTSGEENVKVLDFGLAKIIDENEGVEGRFETQDGALLGTPYYMAPEQVDGQQIDARTDLYALGALLYRMLTGVLPFPGKTPMEVFASQRRRSLPSFSESAPGLECASSVEALVRHLLSRQPQDRPESAIVVGDRIRNLLIELGETPHPINSTRSQQPRLQPPVQDEASLQSDTWRDEGSPLSSESGQWSIGSSFDADSSEDLGLETDDRIEFTGRATADIIYERQLRRGRVGRTLLGMLFLAGLVAGGYWYADIYRKRPLSEEQEPNDIASEANILTLEHPVQGYIGARLSQNKERTDQDVYLVALMDGDSTAKVTVTGVPTVDMVLEVFTDRGVELAKVNKAATGLGESVLLDKLEVKRIQVRVRGFWAKGVPPAENSTDPYILTVSSEPKEPAQIMDSSLKVDSGSNRTSKSGE